MASIAILAELGAANIVSDFLDPPHAQDLDLHFVGAMIWAHQHLFGGRCFRRESLSLEEDSGAWSLVFRHGEMCGVALMR